jgi:hypothetical protein
VVVVMLRLLFPCSAAWPSPEQEDDDDDDGVRDR